MTQYIEERDSIRYGVGDNDFSIVQVLANRYIGANPEIPYTLRAFQTTGVLQTEEGLYAIDMNSYLPEARNGQFAYACGLVWSDNERSLDLGIECLSPVKLYFNGKLHYRSNVIDEIKPDGRARVGIVFRQGWNTLLLQMQKTAVGFGCRIGAEEAKVRILQVLAPFSERSGQAGWIVSASATDEPLYTEGSVPDFQGGEQASGLTWLPQLHWNGAEEGKLPFERLYGAKPGQAAYAWTKLLTGAGAGLGGAAVIHGYAAGPTTVWLNGQQVLHTAAAGEFTRELPHLVGSKHDLLVRSEYGEGSWGFRLSVSGTDGGAYQLQPPAEVQGARDAGPWFYLGPFAAPIQLEPAQVQSLHRLWDSGVPGEERQVYWRLDAPDTWIRPYYENAMLSNKWTVGGATNYARWDYPLGVTMYGLLQAGRLLERNDIIDYALNHIRICTEWYEYSLWDRRTYGFPAINQQLVLMKMLDNCGSFGSAMLEAYRTSKDESFLAVARVIADFIANRLERREDGAFYRTCEGEYSADTMWADDLYMSTPFMIRYAAITGDTGFLDDAARQFLRFRSYLFMPEQKIMSHVFDFKYGRATLIPWGRGNGWSLFSLSELLEALPQDHPDRAELLAFFNEFCEGIAALQSGSGLWHQVLNHPDAYEEASCTAMFAYAFARGVRFGWLDRPERYAEAASKAWQGLTSKAIDRHGNVYGVCSGSRYAFSADYYKYDLLTVLNDNHGIGIMMLAGVELAKLKQGAGA
ncbi:glycoside hydrolase family 88/105 protein [Paenibacillus rigui]|uniref:Glycosyl hydrolase n=1 Tax=Paenibacillus rigui TaxID=554312 RepID=A0A229UTJ5_9BACL|nr:glycoside hydrolase family 88 protein [Paenibacillus rigui]OXM86591.1 glycosyl hydrolase [Paenibacillus rigui]